MKVKPFHPYISRTAIVLLLATVSGCTLLGPDFIEQQPAQLPSSWQQADSEQSYQQTRLWWTQFNDPMLNQLVDLAHQQNLSLESAGLKIVQARAALGFSDGLQYPQSQSVSGAGVLGYQNEADYTSVNLGFDMGWEMDIWGKYARGIESSEANLYASMASYDQVMISITAEVVRNYINYRTFQERVFLSQQNIKIQQRVTEITQIQFESGDVSELDVQQSKTQLYATLSVLPSLEISQIKARNALAALLGMLPEQVEELLQNSEQKLTLDQHEKRIAATTESNIRAVDNYDSFSIIPSIPIMSTEINAGLLARRPDIQIAQMQAKAQSARIGVAEAALYPSFTLFGSIGVGQTVADGGSYSLSDSVYANVGPAFSWNIFQYGRLKNQVRVEDALFQASLTNYNQTVIDAIVEVDNAVEAYQRFNQQSEYSKASVEASVRAFNISMRQYENGLVTYQRLLSTVEKMTRNEDNYAQIKGNIAGQVVQIYKALGGGWALDSGQSLLNDQIIEQMTERTDWGDMLSEPIVRESYDKELKQRESDREGDTQSVSDE
ncbi:Toluene efflux pump outer membrane protein TtgF [Sinobacterium norvegicum]|uniref:Toluene efflux pump outer membrane protein TtgF n=1 Tax=Sinobacterium norvegicum TaxID=1641715 RepID=A0ABM9AHW1_9GAMM|nr:TolC family protein [Sinobacterium norvegicum]CAH0992618.1 Toluene efflux pump outer membrane protein TtgF [Sinobacterium norvegicum]